MIKLTSYTPYLEKGWEKLSHATECEMIFNTMDELEIYRDCLEAEYIDDAYESRVRMMLEFVEYE